MRCCVQSINGLENYSRRALIGNPGDPGFGRLVGAIGRVQRAAGLGLRVTREKDGNATVLFFRRKALAPISEDAAEVVRLLGIDAGAGEYRVVYGAGARDEREIAILTRSMLEILLDMSSYIDVPHAHVVEQRAAPGFADESSATGLKPLVRVQSGLEKPTDAFVTIRYRDYWFWIDDRDLPSKGVFSFLMFLFTLTDSGGGQVSPVLTVPAG
jgi:hypothetical protein